jgi:hypothetical protein
MWCGVSEREEEFNRQLPRAACNDWRFGDADSMSARAIESSLKMPDIRLQAQAPVAKKIDQSLALRRESIYDGLGSDRARWPLVAAMVETSRSVTLVDRLQPERQPME